MDKRTEICSPVRTYLDADWRGNRRKVYEVRVSEDMAWQVRKSMQTFGEQRWPGHIKIWEKPASPEIPVTLMSKSDRQLLRKLSHVRLFVYLNGKPPLLKPKWDGRVLEDPVTHEANWFDYLISAGIDRRSLEPESMANPDEPGHAPWELGELLGFRDLDELQDAMALAAEAGINPTQSRYHYQFLLEVHGQSVVAELAKLIRNGQFEDRFPDHTIESALDQLTDDEDEAGDDQPEDSEPSVSLPLTDDAPALPCLTDEGHPESQAYQTKRCLDCEVLVKARARVCKHCGFRFR